MRTPVQSSQPRSCGPERGRTRRNRIADAALLGRARGHAVAAIIEDAADQKSPGGSAAYPCSVAISCELLLDRIEQGWRDDRGMLGRIARALVVELAKVDPVPEDMSERAIGQWHTPDGLARTERPAPR